MLFKDEELMSVADEVIKFYREKLGVSNFNDPKDRERLKLQVKFDLLEQRKEEMPWT